MRNEIVRTAKLTWPLRRFRIAAPIEQSLRSMIGVHSDVRGWETGLTESRMVERGELAPTVESVKRIADALKTPLAALISEAEKT
jgi:hypothetical protein